MNNQPKFPNYDTVLVWHRTVSENPAGEGTITEYAPYWRSVDQLITLRRDVLSIIAGGEGSAIQFAVVPKDVYDLEKGFLPISVLFNGGSLDKDLLCTKGRILDLLGITL